MAGSSLFSLVLPRNSRPKDSQSPYLPKASQQLERLNGAQIWSPNSQGRAIAVPTGTLSLTQEGRYGKCSFGRNRCVQSES